MTDRFKPPALQRDARTAQADDDVLNDVSHEERP